MVRLTLSESGNQTDPVAGLREQEEVLEREVS